MISVTQNKRNEFKIIVKSEVETVHFVTVDNEWYDNLTKGRLSKEELVKLSFRFLVDREPNTSILREFSLDTISDFFDDYIEYIETHCSKFNSSD